MGEKVSGVAGASDGDVEEAAFFGVGVGVWVGEKDFGDGVV